MDELAGLPEEARRLAMERFRWPNSPVRYSRVIRHVFTTNFQKREASQLLISEHDVRV